MNDVVAVTRRDSPIILGMPHGGTRVPEPIAARLNANGRLLADADWHIARLYDGLLPDATRVAATFHRYVIDANRDPAGVSLYPGQNTTGLVPTSDFDGTPIWADGAEPDAAEVEARRLAFHAPYHAALAAEIARVKALHGFAILYDCHSIRPVAPFLFDGRLPDFNIGDNDGATCAPALTAVVVDACAAAARDGLTHVVNGRFKGGWTTRHYGRPTEGVHAIQMELSQALYMTPAPPFAYDDAAADRLRAHLGRILAAIADLAVSGDLA